MKVWLQNFCLCVSALAFIAACEPGSGDGSDATSSPDTGGMDMTDESDLTDATDATDATDQTDGTDQTDVIEEAYPVIEFEDNKDNPTLGENCDPGGGIESPGADIDAAALSSGAGDLIGYLSGCSTLNAGSCENDNAAAANAEGEPDLPSGEVLDTYTSLNGGLMRCGWQNNATARPGDSITVYEVGKATGTTVETYSVRLCMSVGGNCTIDKTELTGEASFSIDDLLQ